MLITIFTPAYNRAKLLTRLYESLIVQTLQDFEWVIVDDGSLDNTENTVKEFIEESKITIVYFKQENSGKHIAINKGVNLAKGELFFIVDSDDFLPRNALEIIIEKYNSYKNIEDIAGVCGRKGFSKDKVIGNNSVNNDIFCNSLDIRYKHNVKGDLSEVIKTDVLRQFPFPKINDEKFLTEGLVWFRIAKKYKFLFFSDIVYIAEYQDDGLSKASFNIRKCSPEGAILFYKELQSMPIPIIQKIRANINYWRFARYSKRSFTSLIKDVNPLFTVFGLVLSIVFFIKDPK